LRADGRVLLRQRPEKGLLGSMTEVPGSAWAHDFDVIEALKAAPRLRQVKWRKLRAWSGMCSRISARTHRVPRAIAARNARA